MKHTPFKFSLFLTSDSNRFLPSWRNILNTHLGNLIRGHLGLPLVQFRSKSWVQSALHLQRYYQSARKLGTLTHPGLTPLAPHTSLLPPECALSLIGSRPKWSYSASQSERLIRPTMWEACVQHNKLTSNDRSLNDTDEITMITTNIRLCPVSN